LEKERKKLRLKKTWSHSRAFVYQEGKVRCLVWKENSIGFISFGFQNN